MNRPAILSALVLLVVAFWSGNYIAGKIALRELSPMLLAGMRIASAAILMLPVYAWERRRMGPPHLTRAQIVRFALLGLFGVTLNQLFFILGLHRTSVAHAAIVNGMTPLQVLILARLRGQERITILKIAGLTIALAGLAMLKIFAPATGSNATLLGDFFILLTGSAFAIFTVFGKETARLHSAITVNTFAYAASALTLLPVTIWEASRHPLAQIGAITWLAILYMALFSSVAAYLIYYYALARMAASRVSAFSYLQPIFAVAMGAGILGERVGAPEIAGGAVILAGVCLAERG